MTDEPLNREQRRAAEHGTPDNRQDNLLTQSENQAGLGATSGAIDEAGGVALTQENTHLTGPGSGGATQDRGRITNREDIHLGTQPNAGTSQAPERK
jgi:hypothetical protein